MVWLAGGRLGAAPCISGCGAYVVAWLVYQFLVGSRRGSENYVQRRHAFRRTRSVCAFVQQRLACAALVIVSGAYSLPPHAVDVVIRSIWRISNDTCALLARYRSCCTLPHGTLLLPPPYTACCRPYAVPFATPLSRCHAALSRHRPLLAAATVNAAAAACPATHSDSVTMPLPPVGCL
jgi:hypothetical protein